MNNKKKYAMIFLLTATLNVCNIVYLPSMFYVPFQNAFSLSNEQIGTLLSSYGIFALVGYALGGTLADKFNPKWLMVSAAISTGFLGMYTSTLPSYSTMLFIYALYGITTILLPWSALIKTLRMMSTEEDQGKVFGLFESFASITSIVLSYGILILLSSYIAKSGNFGYVIMVYSAFNLLVGVLIAILYRPKKYIVNTNLTTTEGELFNIKQVGKALKLPITWYTSIMVFCLFVLLCASSYLAPFLHSNYLLPVTWSSAVGIAVKYLFRTVAAPCGGTLAQKFGRSSKLLFISMFLVIVASIFLIVLPRNGKFLIIALILCGLFCFFLNSSRVCMYMPISEGRTPMYIYGTVVGITSAIGYSGDVYIWKIFGYLLDTFPKNGYTIIFATAIGVAFLCLITGFFFNGYLNKLEADDKKNAESLQ